MLPGSGVLFREYAASGSARNARSRFGCVWNLGGLFGPFKGVNTGVKGVTGVYGNFSPKFRPFGDFSPKNKSKRQKNVENYKEKTLKNPLEPFRTLLKDLLTLLISY